MPYPNEHAARMADPGKFKTFRRQKNKGGEGVDFIFGVGPDGKTEIQAVRFAKSKFSAEQAKAWMKEHSMKTVLFEPASEGKTDASEEYVFEEFRYDVGEVRNAHLDQDGFLVADAIVTRTGVFSYKNADGSLRRELRHPDDVLRQDSLATMRMLPVTLLHPKEKKVTPENSPRLTKGFTGEDVRVDGKFVRTRIKICDQEAINAIQNGMQQLSLGYTVALLEEDGEYANERYDFRQTDVIYNHLAIVPSARAGNEARIVLDRNDAEQCIEEETGKDNNSHSNKEKRMRKIILDGIEYEASPEVANALAKAEARADKAEAEVKNAATDKSTLQAKLDEANEKIKKAESRDDKAEVEKAVKARLDLVAQATPHLDEETVKNVHQMSDKEIRLAVIKAHFPEANMDGKDDAYVSARYDGAIEIKIEKKDPAAASQRQQLNDQSRKDANDKPDQTKSRTGMVAGMKDAWKTPSDNK